MSSYKVHDPEREQGFTLIELLVVVIIIGILAAIAIPTFLSQRERGWQAELTSTVRNAALEVEAAATAASGSYEGITQANVTSFANTIQGEDTDPVTLNLVGTPTADTFTICGTHGRLGTSASVQYSVPGGLSEFRAETGCGAPVIVE